MHGGRPCQSHDHIAATAGPGLAVARAPIFHTSDQRYLFPLAKRHIKEVANSAVRRPAHARPKDALLRPYPSHRRRRPGHHLRRAPHTRSQPLPLHKAHRPRGRQYLQAREASPPLAAGARTGDHRRVHHGARAQLSAATLARPRGYVLPSDTIYHPANLNPNTHLECLELTDVSVCALANLSKLHRLGLVRVPNLTDEAVYTLAERCGTLRRVYLSYCVMVSVRAVHVLLQRLPKLECLALSGVPAFRSWGLRKLSRELPPYYNKLGRERSCVYTKDCIEQLRQHLTGLFNGVAWVLYGVHEHGRQSDDEELSISSDLDDECDIEDADTIDNPTTSECAESTPLLGSRFVSVSQHAPPSMGEHTAACGLTALCLHVSSATDEKGGPEKRSSWRAISRAAHKSSDGLRGLVCIFKS
ncbi:hypothetical protein DENSPDRAFT_767762 [Dentipellis sp. KUC8613]|nr:hypothetical protein DENSPDRAFT_767762 [Dentipellis sp. KUC8613]